MNYGAIPRTEWRAFGNLSTTVAEIDRRCAAVLQSIQEAFQRDSSIGGGICQISISETEESSTVATVQTPLGNGRFVRHWERSETSFQASLVFERASYDAYDQLFWIPAWAIAVGAYDSATSGAGQEAIHFTYSGYGDNDRTAGYASAIAILGALAPKNQENAVRL